MNQGRTTNVSQGSQPTNFFSSQNRGRLMDLLSQDFQRRSVNLNQKQFDRLNRTLDHYMREVYDYEGQKPVPYLNKAVLGATAQDFEKYLQRQDSVSSSHQSPHQTLITQPPPGTTYNSRNNLLQNESATFNDIQTVSSQEMYHDTNRRYEMIQQQRNEGRQQPPPAPDFRVSLQEEDSEPPAKLFEQARKIREAEASAISLAANSTRPQLQASHTVLPKTLPQPQFLQQSLDRMIPLPAGAVTVSPVYQDSQSVSLQSASLPVRPDGREIYATPAGTQLQTRYDLGLAEANPTIAAPTAVTPTHKLSSSGQAVVTRDDPIMAYRENEMNLIIYSYDRDWLANSTENRYQFSVNFDQANQSNRFRYSPAIQKKLKNITRLDLIKAIFPIESLENLVLQDTSGASNQTFGTVDTSYQTSVLAYPYVVMNLQEYDGNNNGTDNILDRSFGVIHYDRSWESDTNHSSVATSSKPGPFSSQDSRGFVMLSPRYQDCQRIFAPTPLSTLQKLTIQLQRPQGNILSDLPDTFDISEIRPNTDNTFPSAGGASISNLSYFGNLSGLVSTNISYYFIRTVYYFPRSAINVGDRLQIGGISYPATSLATAPGLQNFADWLNSDTGHLVCGIGTLNPDGSYSDGSNKMGYSNFIIIQGRYSDPRTGAVTVNPFPGITGQIIVDNNENIVKTMPRRLLNVSRQTTLVFRVVTREKDGTGQLRADNLF